MPGVRPEEETSEEPLVALKRHSVTIHRDEVRPQHSSPDDVAPSTNGRARRWSTAGVTMRSLSKRVSGVFQSASVPQAEKMILTSVVEKDEQRVRPRPRPPIVVGDLENVDTATHEVRSSSKQSVITQRSRASSKQSNGFGSEMSRVFSPAASSLVVPFTSEPCSSPQRYCSEDVSPKPSVSEAAVSSVAAKAFPVADDTIDLCRYALRRKSKRVTLPGDMGNAPSESQGDIPGSIGTGADSSDAVGPSNDPPVVMGPHAARRRQSKLAEEFLTFRDRRAQSKEECYESEANDESRRSKVEAVRRVSELSSGDAQRAINTYLDRIALDIGAQERYMRSILKGEDVTHKGMVSMDDLYKKLQGMGVSLTPDELKVTLTYFDKDGTNYIDCSVFYEIVKAHRANDLPNQKSLLKSGFLVGDNVELIGTPFGSDTPFRVGVQCVVLGQGAEKNTVHVKLKHGDTSADVKASNLIRITDGNAKRLVKRLSLP